MRRVMRKERGGGGQIRDIRFHNVRTFTCKTLNQLQYNLIDLP